MDPRRLDEVALRFEMKIRGLEYEENYAANTRRLVVALREEKKGDSRAPTPTLKPEDEAVEIMAYLSNLEEKTTLSTFRKKSKDHEDVYAQLCHAEGRVTYTDWTESPEMLAMLDHINRKTAELREKHFADKPLYIIAETNTSTHVGGEAPVEFCEEDEEQIKRLREELIQRKKEKKLKRSSKKPRN
jgi:hypothetical protein